MEELATIVIPDLSLIIMKYVLELCYTGAMVVPQNRLEQVSEALEFLDFNSERSPKKFCAKKVRMRSPNPVPPETSGMQPALLPVMSWEISSTEGTCSDWLIDYCPLF